MVLVPNPDKMTSEALDRRVQTLHLIYAGECVSLRIRGRQTELL